MSKGKTIAITRFAHIFKLGNDKVVKSISKDGLLPPHDPLMELSILEKLTKNESNRNVIQLLDYQENTNYDLVFKYYPLTLKELLLSGYISIVNPYYNVTASSPTENYYRNRFDSNKYAYDFFKQLINGLAYIHSLQIIHRDIKLDNILMEDNGNNNFTLVVTDFGISYDASDENRGNELINDKITDVSTSIYKAPELLFSVRNYTNKVDIWAAFIVLSQLLIDPAMKVKNQKNIPAVVTDGSFSDDDNDGFREEVGSDIKLLFSIFEKFGIPSAAQWPEVINYGTADTFIGMFGNSGDSKYFLDKKTPEAEEYMEQIIPGLRNIEGKQQRETLVQCCIGMASFESTTRFSAEQLLEYLN
ncbi:hypothetical protein TPHA_0D00430 [Tetrapisispora phaffii CBS 4417]|uniref:Protein kinase domain-containing protein n=1 Tax=Tetrapisispora phaffii (strain ATCC 24235 / CBS 4417 / NBRC 1672 / NRRL Y-8282 / UCD 70-5) TaxID=1071381 RepID=G8BS66_TETPH|nr:hypothetical protein TPHA_0D00430 [Tetrapisispora phaffii CBS 4417]CCE62687.1 hypothetical protein TPHA_0D00430 [Tetrapisispora phaffii CBS 4417]